MGTKLKTKRDFLENPKHSNSWYKLDFDSYDNDLILTLADCNRTITWYFGSPNSKAGRKRGKAKSKKMLKVFQEIYDYYHNKED